MAIYGYDTIGANTGTNAVDGANFSSFVAPGGIGAIDSINVYANRTGAGGGYAIRGGLYTSSGGNPGILVSNSSIVISSNIARNAPAWYTVAYSTKPVLTPGATYWIGWQAAKESFYYYDTGATDQGIHAIDAYSDGLEDPFGGGTFQTVKMSVYLIFTPTTIGLAGVSAGVATVAGAASIKRGLAGASAGITTVTGALAVARAFSTSSAGVSTVTGALAVARQLAASSGGLATVTGALTVNTGLAAVSTGTATVAGAIQVERGLATTSTGIAAVSGAIAVGLALSSAVAGIATVTDALAVARQLAAVTGGVSTVAGALTVTTSEIALAGVSTGLASVTGALSVTRGLASSSAGAAAVEGALAIARALVGASAGVTTVSGTLYAGGGEPGDGDGDGAASPPPVSEYIDITDWSWTTISLPAESRGETRRRNVDITLSAEDRALLNSGALAARHGKLYESARANRLYVAASATAGIALIVSATTGNHPTLWNPLGSGRILSIRKLHLAYVSGANAPGSLAWNITENAGSQAATASPILTFTKVAVANAMAGGAVDSKAFWAPAVNTYTAAPAYYRPTNLSLFTGVAATAVAPFAWGDEYDGDLQIAPGTALSLVTQQATTTALFRITVLFEEIDY